jgi:hypothetical protein
VRRETRADRVGRCIRGECTRIDNDVHGRQFVLVQTEMFAHEPLQTIAAHGVASGLDADREPKARVTQVIRARNEQEQRIGVTLTTRVNDVELGLVGEALRAQESARRCGRLT